MSAPERATSNAPFSSKDGFSVVAPINVMVPSSISGRKLSCWARLKPVNFIHEQQGPVPLLAPVSCLIEDFAQIGDAGENRGNLLEMQAGLAGEQSRDRGLPGAWRTPQDDTAQPPGRQQPGEHADRTGEMFLANDVAKRLGP